MNLLKVEDGKRETENFFVSSDFADFAGLAHVTRDIINNTVSLINDDKIERVFPWQDFVIEAKKQNWGEYLADDFTLFYVGAEGRIYGIQDDIQGENPYWKIIKNDSYVQVYGSIDRISWVNYSGVHITHAIVRQGFKKKGAKPLVLENFAVYKNPFITIKNFPESTIVELRTEEDIYIKERVFDDTLQCEIFLDNLMKGILVFKDPEGAELYRTDVIDLQYGDVYVSSPYELEILYKGAMAKDTPVLLDSLIENIIIHNAGTEVYENLNISTMDNSEDIIQLSLDNVTYTDSIIIDKIEPLEDKEVFIQISRAAKESNFIARDFQLNIE